MGALYLTLTLAAWTAVAFVYPWADKKNANRMVMSAAVGLAGTFWALAYVFARGIDLREAAASQIVVGAVLSVCITAYLPAFMAAVARGDLSITWTVMSLSFALASVLSMIWPGERVTGLAVAGLVLTAVAVILLGLDMHRRHRTPPSGSEAAPAQSRSDGPGRPRKGWGLFDGIAFVVNSGSMYCFTIASHLPPDASPAHSAMFLLATYGVLTVLSVPAAIWARRTGSVKAGLGSGLAIGSIFLVGGLLQMLTLSVGVPACVIFPITTGGSNVAVALLSFLFLHERPTHLGWLGIATGLAAIVCLGVGMK
jgi:drug/metabolite transporter (DMT)-like permease